MDKGQYWQPKRPCPSPNQNSKDFPKQNWLNFHFFPQVVTENLLLPGNFRPTLYEIEIRPYIGPKETWGNRAFTFEGRARITMTCVKPTAQLVFHSRDLTLESVEFKPLNRDDPVRMSRRIEFDYSRHFVYGHLTSECQLNQTYSLDIKYHARISDKLNGFYISSYQDARNQKK